MSKEKPDRLQLQPFFQAIAASPVTQQIRAQLSENRHATMTNQWGSAAIVLAAILQSQLSSPASTRPMLVITAHLDEADDALDQLEFFRPGCTARLYPAFEVLPGESNLSHELASQRLELLANLAETSNSAPNNSALSPQPSALPTYPDFIIAPIQALMQPSPNRELLADQLLPLSLNTTIPGGRDGLVRWLTDHGYTRLDAVEDAGDFAVRGEIVDVWPPGATQPVRVDFFDDQIETMHFFDIESLGPTGDVALIRLAALGDRGTWPIEKTTSLLNYLPPETLVWLIEPSEVQEQAKSYFDRLSDARGVYPPNAVLKNIQQFAWAEVLGFGGPADAIKLPCKSVLRFDTKADEAVRELAELAQKPGTNSEGLQKPTLPTPPSQSSVLSTQPSRQVVVVCESKSEITRLTDILDVKRPGASAQIQMTVGSLHLGFEWNESELSVASGQLPDPKTLTTDHWPLSTPPLPPSLSASPVPLLLLGHHEIFHRYNVKRRLRSVQNVGGARAIDSFLDLQPGDFVVHVHHGIARYEGMNSITRDGKASEFLTLKFAGDATLHVPVTQIHLVQKYVGGAHGRPPLSVLGGQRWSKQKEEVAAAVEEMAAELLEVQAAREHAQGIAYPPDTTWQKEFENAFPYPPTEDQARSADEIKSDMARPRPMDRLLCGDVGYGKTEVSMRAAFKAIEFGKQVAVLVPTTVLCEQHEETFKARCAGYPFIIESISRFKTASQVKKILERTRMGQVDVLIGTHRILSKDVVFADLGLVIIDEEQRFGVENKERLKKLRLMVDVLTMTATPIPRTLHMSLLGIRDISNLSTPPQDRRSVVTEVIPHDKARIKTALQRELARNGQVFFVHNKVYNIESVADEIRQMVPDARIVIGHGQMPEHGLEDVMKKFIHHQADILVSTTIIESGIDIPNANTMFINEAENFGLSDLHQLRGRVGRYKHRAYCYLLLSPDKSISEKSGKRLKAMEEYASLGAGFKIALRDLEIRGAGNILGAEQSGHIAAVGYEMYCQLLEEAVKRIKNEPVHKPKEVNVDIGLATVLPKSYVDSERQRMDVYRRLSRCQSVEMIEALAKDIADAFGPMPKAVTQLFGLAEIKVLAQQWAIVSIILKDPDVVFTIEDLTKLGPLLGKGVGGAGGLSVGSVRIADEKTVHLRLPKPYLEPETLLNVLRNLLNPNAPKPEPQKPPVPAKPAVPNPQATIRRRL